MKLLNIKLLTVLILLTQSAVVQSGVANLPVQIGHPVRFIEVEGAIPFEEFATLAFRVDLSKILRQECIKTLDSVDECAVTFDLQAELKDIRSYIVTGQHHRNKREAIAAGLAIFGGSFLGGLVGSYMFSNDQEIMEKINKVHEILSEHHQKYMLMQTEVKSIGENLNKMEEIAKVNANKVTENNEAIKLVTAMLIDHMRADHLYRSEAACQKNFVPVEMISGSLLASRLKQLRKDLLQDGLELAISESRVEDYLKLPIADCVVNLQNFTVFLKVPIQKITRPWKILELQHPKFAFNGKTCKIGLKVEYIAQSGNKIVVITPPKSVSEGRPTLWRVPEFSSMRQEDESCINAVLTEASPKELATKCSIVCDNDRSVVISPQKNGILELTNLEKLTVNCSGSVKYYSFERLGNVRWQRKCRCTAVVNGAVFIEEPISCLLSNASELELVHVIPTLWSNLSTVSSKIDTIFHDFGAIYNVKWPEKVKLIDLSLNDNEDELNFSYWSYAKVSWGSGISLIALFSCIGVIFLLKKFYSP